MWPTSGAERAMGRLRKRSNMPLRRSVLSAKLLPIVANMSACTAIPGITNCR